ncbi:AAA family ATPase [Oceanihabitans sediminis]|uniref:AAA family ATPase n=1 Tax=Oceanihabitans sediminis TaxID=1812012 RepID=UPI00299EE23A|nr:AAA family ATPase [Oceanihabitans sediminis]MDX1279340.1 AAA family ATPase [Oceanihabitans sediminis]
MSLPLIEKYRPKSFEQVIGVDVEKLKNLISSPLDMPNLLFYGSQGIGKTTCAKIIINELSPIDVLRINGSDTTGVDTIREKVYNYMMGMSSVENKPKIVWIEEFDFMSASAYAALRAMIEQFMSNARFICTCNYIEKIPEPIQSRFTPVEFKTTGKDELLNRLSYICKEEGIIIDNVKTLETIIDSSKGDIRATINLLQQLSSNDKKEISIDMVNAVGDLTEEVFDLLANRQWSKIRYNIPQKNPDYKKLLVELDEMFFNSDLEVSKKAKINEEIAKGLYEMAFVFDENICFSAICSRIIKCLY